MGRIENGNNQWVRKIPKNIMVTTIEIYVVEEDLEALGVRNLREIILDRGK